MLTLLFTKNVDEVIYLFCSLAFANDVELGWDPTIQRVLVGKEIQYDITFKSPPSVYRTVKILVDFGADALTGRSTRVFKAYDTKKSSPTEDDYVVIKDAWRDHDRLREDKILARVVAAITESNPDNPNAGEDARKYFLTVLQAEDVMIDGKTDNTLQLFRGCEVPDDCDWLNVRPEKEPSRRSHVLSTGHTPTVPFREEMPARRKIKAGKISQKIHFREVFAELGTPIFDSNSLGDVLETLEHALKGLPSSSFLLYFPFTASCAGLQLMHRAGWVHRDISAGNVLRCGRQGKIADLEYAKALNSTEESHDARTVSFS